MYPFENFLGENRQKHKFELNSLLSRLLFLRKITSFYVILRNIS
jgi:hypothetical protein